MFSSDFIQSLPSYDQLFVAYSGGMDSHALLFALTQLNVCLSGQCALSAIHVHHGLSPNADKWAQHCQSVCDDLSVPLHLVRASPKVSSLYASQGLESAAREQRYAAFKETMQAHASSRSVLLLAHHSDDQAETFLLQLLRGSGLKGLSAMPQMTSLDNICLRRPFLQASRLDLFDYAKKNQLLWVDDESNDNLSFDRNYLRQSVMPLLEKRWPKATHCIARSAGHCAEAHKQLASDCHEMLKIACVAPDQLDIDYLNQLTETQQSWLIRTWLHSLSVIMPSVVKLKQVIHEVLPARHDRNPCVDWGEHSIRRYQQALYYVKMHSSKGLNGSILNGPIDWNGSDVLALFWGTLNPGKGDMPHPEWQIRFRCGGEKMRLHPDGPSRLLKSLMQEWAIPPWYRDHWPLVYYRDVLVAVPSFKEAVCHIHGDWHKHPGSDYLRSIRFNLYV